MQLIRSFSVVIMCWAGLAAAANDIPMTARQSQALGIETVAADRAFECRRKRSAGTGGHSQSADSHR